MGRVCILTDGTAQFTEIKYPGSELVHVIPVEIRSSLLPEDRNISVNKRVVTRRQYYPSKEDFLDRLFLLSTEYEAILVITLSRSLEPAVKNAQQAVSQYGGRADIRLIDSQTTAIGMGLLVQKAAAAAVGGATLVEIDQKMRSAIHSIYSMFCIPELHYLQKIGHIGFSQAIIGEMLGLFPIFVLEEGNLTPLGKVRTHRHILEYFQDFIEEFTNPDHIALLKPASMNHFRLKQLYQYIDDVFPEVPFSIHVSNTHLAALLGPQCMGLVVMENTI